MSGAQRYATCFGSAHGMTTASHAFRWPAYCTMGKRATALRYSPNAAAARVDHLPRSRETVNFESDPIIQLPAAASAAAPPAPLLDAGRTSTSLRLPPNGELDTLKLPALYCTFPSLIHPHYHSHRETCDAWIEMLVQPPTPAARRFLHDCLLPRLVCQFVPTAQLAGPRLMHVIKFISWLMVADDDDDHPDVRGSDCNATAHHADLVLAILRKRKGSSVHEASMLRGSTCTERKSARMLRALEELWEEISEEMSPALQKRFTSTMADYFEGIKVQALFRRQVRVPDMKSYLDIRRQSSFTIPCFVLLQYALGIELDDATFYNPLLQELQTVVLDYISLCNDVVSCNIEVRMGDYFNLPFILYDHSPRKFNSLQNALDHVAKITKDLNAQANALLSTIYNESEHFEPLMVPLVHAYAYALCISMSGTLTWFFESARYNQPQDRAMLCQITSSKAQH